MCWNHTVCFRCRTPSKQYARRTVAASSRDSILSERNPSEPARATTSSPSYDSIQYYTSAAAVAAAAANSHSRSVQPHRLPNSHSFPNSSASTPTAAAAQVRAVSPTSRPASSLSNSAFSNTTSNAATSPATPLVNNHKYYAPSSGLNSASSSMVNFHQAASSSRGNLAADAKPNGAYSSVPSAWVNSRHTPSPAPSLPAAMTRTDSMRNSGRSSNAPPYESASLDRKDNRKSVASSSQSDFARYSQTMSATESRSLRRSKRGKATINSSAPAAEDHKSPMTSSNRETDE